ncbi:hypothetical protein ACWF9G_08770 [Nocardia sp. NPDC055029]|uniref:hypothetical protein n=1 Tax=Nocardia sp. NPDC060259 TaxID=3347088 RepID=UPI00364633ED
MMDEVLIALTPAVATGALALSLRVLWGLTLGKPPTEIRVTVEGPSGRREVVLDGLKDDPSTRDAVRNLVGQLVDLQDSPVKHSDEFQQAQRIREAELKQLVAPTRENGQDPA